MSLENQLQKAKILIQQKHYDDARALLITVDDPKAELWLHRLNQMDQAMQTKVTPVQHVTDKSFTTKFFLTIMLLFLWVLPGIIALAIFGLKAKKYPNVPGARGLILLNRYTPYLIILAPIIFFAFIILTLRMASARLPN